jgi:hypothetical protein
MDPTHVLLAADWTVDPHAVVAAASRRASDGPATFGLVVPAWLHGFDWAGDPLASVPCATRALDAISELTVAAGLAVETAGVGDPDPTTAILDALETWPADELLLCAPGRRLAAGPFDLAHRAHRLTGLPVQRVAVSRRMRGSGHCTPAVA